MDICDKSLRKKNGDVIPTKFRLQQQIYMYFQTIKLVLKTKSKVPVYKMSQYVSSLV